MDKVFLTSNLDSLHLFNAPVKCLLYRGSAEFPIHLKAAILRAFIIRFLITLFKLLF